MLLGVHKNTVRTWLTSGLQPIDNRRPILILGRQLSGFLHARRNDRRQPCRAGQFYCLRCRAPRTPAASGADYLPITSSSGNLRGTCSACGTRMYRRVSIKNFPAVAGDLQVMMLQARQRIADSPSPSLNSNFDEVA